MSNRDVITEVRCALKDPFRVADQLGLEPRRSSRGAMVRCPVHAEKTPSCSVTRGPDGTIRVRCFGCDWSGDVLHLVAAVHGLDPRRDFKAVLEAAARLAGVLLDTETTRGSPPEQKRVYGAVPCQHGPSQDYPPPDEVLGLWQTARPLLDDEAAAVCLAFRGIYPDVVQELDLARALHPDTHETRIPGWARFRGNAPVSRPWSRSGHRILVPVYDCDGQLRSLRAWLVTGEPDKPKRVPPVGHRASGLVLANRAALEILRGERFHSRLVIVEGEPDFLARAIVNPNEPVLGVLSGSWHEGFAERIPYGSEVYIRTHLDKAGERYAQQIVLTLRHRARLYRLTATEAA